MPDLNFDTKKQQVRRELEKMGYQNIPDNQLAEFTTDLQRLMCHDRASRGSRSMARSGALLSPSSRGERDSSWQDGSSPRLPYGLSARSSQYYRPDSASSRGYSTRDCTGLHRSAPHRKMYRCVDGRPVATDETTSGGCGAASEGSEFRNLDPELDSDGTPDYDPCDDESIPCSGGCDDDLRAICARPFPKLHVSPIVPPELLPPRRLARPGFRVTCEMLSHPIRSDPCTRMKWYADYWSTLKIPGITKHHNLMNAVRNMLDTYDYIPRPLNHPDPVWNMSLLREQPAAMLKLNWC